jgi:hypothetical protein
MEMLVRSVYFQVFVRDDASGQVGHHAGLGQSVPRAYASVQERQPVAWSNVLWSAARMEDVMR